MSLIDWVLRRSLPPPPVPTAREDRAASEARAARERREAASTREHARIMEEQRRARASLDYTAAVLGAWSVGQETGSDDATG